MPFWLALLMRCARVGALRESRSIAFESSNPSAPDINDPDSSAYKREASSVKEELTKRYFCYPPNRRVNFTKFGISTPFHCDWENLTKGWSNVEDFYVLRNRELLLHLRSSIRTPPAKRKDNSSSVQETRSELERFDEHQNCLIHVQVSMLGKGAPKRFAIVCMPTPEDLEGYEADENWVGPVEKRHVDPNEKSRKVLRKSHLALLKRLRRQRVRRKKLLGDKMIESLKESAGSLVENSSGSLHRKIIADQLERMSRLYLPERREVRYSCDREVMGYLTMGDFSFSRAGGMGIGYVTLPSLIAMSKMRSDIVLVRNTQTRQYRLAKVDILGL